MSTNDFSTEHLTGEGKKIADAIVKWMTDRNGRTPYGGGCRAFYSAKEWKERGEAYGTNGALILCHDGGDLYYHCDYDAGCWPMVQEFHKFLESKGYYVECCTSWYSAVYKL